jgi:4-nitrophenyl phosphatase
VAPFDFTLDKSFVYSSAYCTAKYVSENIIKDKSKDKVYVIGERGIKDELKLRGIIVINDVETETKDQITDSELVNYPVDPDVVAVVVGVLSTFNYRKLSIAVLYI